MRAVQRFEVSLKAAIVRDRQLLLLREADTGYWELPGGRIDIGEEWSDHAQVLSREIGEELGLDVRVQVGDEAISFVRQRKADDMYLFLLVRMCRYDGGTIRLSGEHAEYRWCGANEWQSLSFPEVSGYRRGMDAIWKLIGDRASF